MKVERQRLLKRMCAISMLITATVCTGSMLVHNEYTYTKREMNEASIIENSDDDPSSSREGQEKIVTLLKNSVENIIEDKKQADEVAYRKSLEVYDGMTMDELAEKLDRNLKSTLKGTGRMFAEYSISLGIDPYVAVSIVLLETGCNWECSQLVKQCNNVGGIKGGPGCFGGSYKKYSTLEDGIEHFMTNLYKNYYAKGLTTPEAMNSKYAESSTWAKKVNKYIKKIQAS